MSEARGLAHAPCSGFAEGYEWLEADQGCSLTMTAQHPLPGLFIRDLRAGHRYTCHVF
ncbi:UNVERIFIED_ORG: hypothetical protein J2W65_002958 [Pseudomonas parafulva]|uniref:hypothetical protein n=1 Tax=Pseudomonas TaxID=286 RepID=UPI000AE360A1|nr:MULTISPECIES: hypothetical protein [Pseudomonas]MCY4125919.1 hypothetical protein [Pseudomonas sp.]MDP9557316.1 hypothetical protein [Pseudomonas parafulva]MBA1217463.1 hypothetical protein [Pseudomonas fulva]MBN6791712.1 hypothetical protein [Pseudomonas fulva]MBN6796801.1 hypothetical protein [Pseudomonas fulva]